MENGGKGLKKKNGREAGREGGREGGRGREGGGSNQATQKGK